MFLFHVARLAQADKVASNVCLCGCLEVAERGFVVNRQRFADVVTTMCAATALIRDNARPRLKPTPASIGSYPADVAGRQFTVEHARCLKTVSPAKPCKAVLSGKPIFLKKGFSTLLACAINPRLPRWMISACYSWFERIGGALASAKLVSEKVGFGAGIEGIPCLTLSIALERAEPRLVRSVGLNFVGFATFIANQFNSHVVNIHGCFEVAKTPEPTQEPLL